MPLELLSLDLYLKEYPLLLSLYKAEHVSLENGEYIGHAFDGAEVLLGREGEERLIEKYLTSHPTPKDW